MGKKRIKDFSADSDSQQPSKKTDKGKRSLVKTGKEHGRITDMGAVAMAEAEQLKAKEKEIEKASAKSAKKETQAALAKRKKVAKKRSKKYLAAKKQVDRTKVYPVEEAVKVTKKTSISRFDGQMEMHLIVKEKKLKRIVTLPYQIDKQKKLTIASEKKAPLIHLVLGRLKTKDAELVANIQAIIASIGPKNIKKAVIKATMGPGIKVALTSSKKT
jgi:hypothetical protein